MIEVDLRFSDPANASEMEAKLKALKSSRPDIETTVTGKITRPPSAALFGGVVSLDLINGFATNRTKPNMNPPMAVFCSATSIDHAAACILLRCLRYFSISSWVATPSGLPRGCFATFCGPAQRRH